MKKILVPTDFSTAAYNAHKYALNLAEELGAKVTCYHVVKKGEELPDRPERMTEALAKEDIEAALEAFEWYGKQIQTSIGGNVECTYIIEYGSPANSIVEYADFMNADLIILDTKRERGTSGILDTWLGNVGTKVIEKTTVPVLLVPEMARFKGLRHIVYATNFREKEQRVPKELMKMTNAFDLQLSCIHVRRPDSDFDPIQYAFMRDMYRMELDNFRISFFTINHENVMVGLNSFLTSRKADLLAMLSHENLTLVERLFSSGLTRQMAFQTKIPLLILHQESQTN